MKKIVSVSILTLFVLVAFVPPSTAEMAKEGTGSGTTYYTSTYQVLAQGKLYIQINYDARGVSAIEDETSPFYGASCQCVGAVKVVRGESKESGLCTFTRPDKDKIFMSYEGTGKGGVAKGNYILVGGTGKCEGITGNGEWARTSLQGPVKGAGASFSKSTGSWKIP